MWREEAFVDPMGLILESVNHRVPGTIVGKLEWSTFYGNVLPASATFPLVVRTLFLPESVFNSGSVLVGREVSSPPLNRHLKPPLQNTMWTTGSVMQAMNLWLTLKFLRWKGLRSQTRNARLFRANGRKIPFVFTLQFHANTMWPQLQMRG